MIKERGLSIKNGWKIFAIIMFIILVIIWSCLYHIRLLPLESTWILSVLSATAIIALFHLMEITRARKSTAFLDLYKYLQQEYVREARRILYRIPYDNFEDWKEYQIRAAEIVCHTHDVTGLMVSKKLIEEDLVVPPRRRSIIKSWIKAQPMIDKYRDDRGKDFWAGFQSLYNRAKRGEITETIKCPSCGETKQVQGSIGDRVIVTCSKCNSKGVFQFRKVKKKKL